MTFHRPEGPRFKRSNLVHQPARDNAQGKECTLMLPCCNRDTSTTALAHIRLFGAAGVNQKPDDWFAVFACSACHDALDARNAMTSSLWGFEDLLRALRLTLKQQFNDGVFRAGKE